MPFPYVLSLPPAPIDVALRAYVYKVRRRLRAAHDDEQVRVRLVHALRGVPEEVVPVLAPVESALRQELADLVPQAHADDARLRDGPRGYGLETPEPVVRVEEPAVGFRVPGPFVPPPVPVREVAWTDKQPVSFVIRYRVDSLDRGSLVLLVRGLKESTYSTSLPC